MKKVKLLFILLLISFQAISQTNFLEHIITPEVGGGQSVFSIDLDGDGDPDILSASYIDNKIAWYQNNGNGNFGAQQIITTSAIHATSIFSIDLDGDGDNDVLSASSGDNKVAWYQNDGNGNFGAQQVISTDVDTVQAIFAIDLDGDGDNDVLSASPGDDKIAWYQNDGNGNFSAQQIITTDADQARAVYAIDLDGDGDNDVLSASSQDDKIAWYQNDGNGSFSAQQIISTDIDGARTVFAIDLDGDGDNDVVAASFYTAKIVWYANNGNGTFGSEQILSEESNYVVALFATDLDGDGDNEILAHHNTKIVWFQNEGSGNFSAQQSQSVQSYTKSLYANDLDGDGDNEILSAGYGSVNVAWYENAGSESFDTHILAGSISDLRSIQPIDLDGDGMDDILSTFSINGNINWFHNDGDGNFVVQQVFQTTTQGVQSVWAVDINGDENNDIVVGSSIEGKIFWYQNDGDGNFGAQQIVSSSATFVSHFLTKDIDGDGDNDIVATIGSDNKTVWYQNDGNGSFGDQQVIASLDTKVAFIADLDGDGDNDVLSLSTANSKITWHKNNGSGVFPSSDDEVIDFTTPAIASLFVADLNGDGHQDILATYYYDNKVVWYQNDGNDNFGYHQVISNSANGAMSVVAFDGDNDGDMDVLSASTLGDKIAWYQNDGSGNFGDELIISTNADGAYSAQAFDCDGDGDMDVISSSVYDHKIAWYENLVNIEGLSGYTYYDFNQNGVWDNDTEMGLSNQTVVFNPGDNILTGQTGFFYQLCDLETEYTINWQANADWSLVNDTSYTLTYQASGNNYHKDFGLFPNFTTHDGLVNLSSENTRCNSTVFFYLRCQNTGTYMENGSLTLSYDPSTPFISSPNIFTTIDTANHLLTWTYDSLYPFQYKDFYVEFAMPDQEGTGQVLNFVATMYDTDSEVLDQYTYQPTVLCSFDPNDKMVTPAGVQDANYTLHDQMMTYTVRFQNTGNAAAIDVRIVDEIDSDLDISTLRIVNSSFPAQASISGQTVEFLFHNIWLADSTHNEPESHGFVTYEIMPITGLADYTTIDNTAHIIFDQNDPVITNTTTNTMVTEIPVGLSETTIQTLELIPNPASDRVSIATNEPVDRLLIYNNLGQLVLSQKEIEVDVSHLPKGVYTVEVMSQSKVAVGKLVVQ